MHLYEMESLPDSKKEFEQMIIADRQQPLAFFWGGHLAVNSIAIVIYIIHCTYIVEAVVWNGFSHNRSKVLFHQPGNQRASVYMELLSSVDVGLRPNKMTEGIPTKADLCTASPEAVRRLFRQGHFFKEPVSGMCQGKQR